jgi:hypothetical protein
MSITAVALAHCRAKIGKIYQDRNNSHLRMSYASLSEIAPKINEICAEHGVAYEFNMNPINEDFMSVNCTVYSENSRIKDHNNLASDVLEFSFLLPIEKEAKGMSLTQKFGATLTYARRYALQVIFNLAFTDEEDLDDDKHTNKTTPDSKLPAKQSSSKTAVEKKETAPVPTGNITADQYRKFKEYVWKLVPAAEHDWSALLKTKHKLNHPTDITQFIADDICGTYNIDKYNLNQ